MARKCVINLTSATATLGRNQSGSLVVLDRAAGIVVTLPAASRGLEYEFAVKTAVTTNSYTIVAAGTNKVRGVLQSAHNDVASKSFVGNPATHVKVAQNGTTTGGQVGTAFKVVCDADGIWTFKGATVSNTAAAATSFSA